MLEKDGIDAVPYYKIASKREVKEGEPPLWKERSNLPEVTTSFDDFMRKQVVEDFGKKL